MFFHGAVTRNHSNILNLLLPEEMTSHADFLLRNIAIRHGGWISKRSNLTQENMANLHISACLSDVDVQGVGSLPHLGYTRQHCLLILTSHLCRRSYVHQLYPDSPELLALETGKP